MDPPQNLRQCFRFDSVYYPSNRPTHLGYEGHLICVESQFDLAGGCWHVVTVQDIADDAEKFVLIGPVSQSVSGA